jgi:hypothetical protein
MRVVPIMAAGRTFAVRCASDDWASFTEALWDPAMGSLSVAEEILIQVDTHGSGWRLQFEEHFHISEDPWILAATLRNLVTAAGLRRARGLVALHAATARRADRVLLIVGPNEAGKTTLLLDLVDNGWSSAGDDLAVISSDGLTVRTFAKPVQVRDPDRWSAFLDRWSPPAWLPPPSRSGLLPPRAVGMAAGVYRPLAVVFPSYGPNAQPILEPMVAGLATALCAANCQNPGGADQGSLRAFAELSKTVPSASLRYGSSLEARNLIQRFIAFCTLGADGLQ